MTALQGAPESGAPVSRLHERQSYDPADYPVPTAREGSGGSRRCAGSASCRAIRHRAVRGSRRAQLPQQGQLQGRAAGRGRARCRYRGCDHAARGDRTDTYETTGPWC